MYRSKVSILDRTIIITAGRDRVSTIRHHITAPLNVESMTRSAHGCTMQVLFGKSWSWSEFPAELKERYDAELAAYALLIPDQITSRTVLPPNGFYSKYVPFDTDLETMRENRKTPEERQREADEAQRRREEVDRHRKEREQAANALILAQAECRAKYPFLTEGRSAADASKNLKILLTRLWPETKFSVVSDTFSMGDSINVRWTDGPTEEQVSGYADQFQSGYVNAMEDMTEHVNKGMHVFGDAKYVHCNRKISEGLSGTVYQAVQAAITSADAGGSGEIAGTEFSVYRTPNEGYRIHGLKEMSREYRQHYGDVARLIAEEIVGEHETPEADLTKQPETPRRTPAPSSEPITVDGVTISRNEEKNGLEVKFSEKPEESVLVFLKSRGFRWSKFSKLWYARYSETLMEEVQGRVLPVHA